VTRALKWFLAGTSAALIVVIIALSVSASRIRGRMEDRARRAVIEYLEKRFDSQVEFQSLQLSIPQVSSWSLLWREGRGVLATVDGNGLVVRLRRDPEAPPFFRIPHFRFHLDLGLLTGPSKTVPRLELEGMEIAVPPKGERPHSGQNHDAPDVAFNEVHLSKAVLLLLPRDRSKPPLKFDIDDLLLKEAGRMQAMTYDAHMMNPRPPGRIDAAGHFGPWNVDEPGDTSLDGDYRFNHADLSVFGGIRGILDSTGKFAGSLDHIDVSGDARVPDFALRSAGNRIPLETHFEALVDGTNGNTVLKPVTALLGKSTRFATSGAIIKHEDVGKRAITLAVSMKKGDLAEILRLGMKGDPFMKGRLQMQSKISIPPLSAKVKEKLGLAGDFSVTDALFTKDAVQDKVDELSRRGQGQPKNPAIDNVVYNMHGHFDMQNQKIDLSELAFEVPGAAVSLDGRYDMESDDLDFHGELRLDAKVSQTMTGWKRWLAKPLDPFFSKDGAGTLLKIQITGTSDNPQFGRDHRSK
jgi:hypothetical protein